MNFKNAKSVTVFGVIAIFAIVSITVNNAHAEEEFTYKMVNDIEAELTFTFRDGVEVTTFPIFKMQENYVDKTFSTFQVEGVLGESPHLHKALDEAYKYRNSGSFEWDYRYFDVNVNFHQDGQSIQKLDYYNCEVDSYIVDTLNDDYESYLSSSSGFAIIDKIDFECGGVEPMIRFEKTSWREEARDVILNHGSLPFTFDRDTRTIVEFEFDKGTEIVEFPIFELTSGYEESEDNVTPSFEVIGTVSNHPLLTEAIERSRLVKGIANGVNVDFEASVKFVSGDDLLRQLDFKDCRVDEYVIQTQFDKEEGFTGKRGFAHVEEIGVECIGLSGVNPYYDDLIGKSWQTTFVEHKLPRHEYPTGTGGSAVATFTFTDGIEVIDFPMFVSNDVMQRENTSNEPPGFTLVGPVAKTTMLYDRADENLSMTSATGTNPVLELFQVDVDFMYGDKSVRTLNYKDCRVVDYVVKTQHDKEESFFKGFALTNEFEFECHGYHPNSPIYDSMFESYDKAKTTSTKDLKSTDQWKPGFSVQ